MRDAVTVLLTVVVIFALLSAYPPTRRDLRLLAADLRRDFQRLLHKLGLAPPPPRRPAPGTPARPAPSRPPQRERPQPKPGAPGLDSEVPTRNAAYRALLDRIEEHADLGGLRVLALSGPPGSGKLTLARRYAARMRHHGYIVDPPIEVVCTGRAYIDGPAIVGQGPRAPMVDSPDELPGALRAANEGAVIIHHAERMSRDAQCSIENWFQSRGWIVPIGTGRMERVRVRMIATHLPRFPADYRPKVRDGLEDTPFEVPSLAERPEDIEPNFDHILRGIDQRRGATTTFEPGAREEYVRFATGRLGLWRNGFHDLIASAERLVKVAGDRGVISGAHVRREITFLGALWAGEEPDPASVESDGKAETSALPSLEYEVPTRNEVYRAELVRLTRRADLPDPQMITIVGTPGSGRMSLIQRYVQRRRAQGHVGPSVLEYTVTGDDYVDCAALLGHHDPHAGAPPTQTGLLVNAADGVVILHGVDRLGEGGQLLLLAVHQGGSRRPLPAYRDVVVRAHVIALIPDPKMSVYYRRSLATALEDGAFEVPDLKHRLRDIEPSIAHLLRTLSASRGTLTTFEPEARVDYLYFAMGSQADWTNGFDDLERSIGRLVAAAQGSVISADDVEAEIDLLGHEWDPPDPDAGEPDQPGEDPKAAMLRRSLARIGLTFEGIKAATKHLPPPPPEPPLQEAWDALTREVPELPPEIRKRMYRIDALVLPKMIADVRAAKSEWDAAQKVCHVPVEQVRNRVPYLRDYLARYGLTYARLKGN